ncbi:MAG TPA: hypothetical protein VG123_05325 [Streptosporangiaceae bacterium]|nr:hypothetical protein [Streptosporangiaceae bacterium]
MQQRSEAASKPVVAAIGILTMPVICDSRLTFLVQGLVEEDLPGEAGIPAGVVVPKVARPPALGRVAAIRMLVFICFGYDGLRRPTWTA